MTENFWRTSISQVKPNDIRIRGYSVIDLMQKKSFGDVVYLLFKGELPSGNEGRLIEAILIAGADHSLAAPSADAVRFVASGGVPLQAAVAAGITALGDYHGGAIEQCARMLLEAKPGESVDIPALADTIVKEKKVAGQRILGYGHPMHNPDPRAEEMLRQAKEYGLFGPYCELATAIARVFAAAGKSIPLNVDGAIAAVMLEMGLDWRLGKGFYVVSRAAGLVAHAFEQITAEKPFKEVDYHWIAYSGPPPRPLPE